MSDRMGKFLVLTVDGKTSKVIADYAQVVEGGVLTFYEVTEPKYRMVIAYAAGAWTFFGVLDAAGADVPNLEA